MHHIFLTYLGQWTGCLTLLVVTGISSQQIQQNQPFHIDQIAKSTPSVEGLLNPARFSLSHQYAFSFSTDGQTNQSLGMVINRLKYNFSIPLQLSVDLGFSFDPTQLLQNNPTSRNLGINTNMLSLVKQAELTYHPKPNVLLSIQYKSIPPRLPTAPGLWNGSSFFDDPR